MTRIKERAVELNISRAKLPVPFVNYSLFYVMNLLLFLRA